MGALHSGHLALVRRAAQLADRTLVSIFVNPSQFAPHEDLARYPRDEAGDLAKLAAEGCHLVWAPTAAEMYPDGFATRIAPAGTAQGLESDFRPHFFGGVATVCAKLFGAATPDVAVFGEKDYQQLCVVRQMVRDLNMPIDIVGVETTREADGLALSSRNAYLTAEERKVAPALNRVLRDVAGKANAVMRGAGPAKNKPPRPTPLVRDPTLPPQAHQLADLDADLCCGSGGVAGRRFRQGRLRRRAPRRYVESGDGNGRRASTRARRRMAGRDPPHRQRRRMIRLANRQGLPSRAGPCEVMWN